MPSSIFIFGPAFPTVLGKTIGLIYLFCHQRVWESGKVNYTLPGETQCAGPEAGIAADSREPAAAQHRWCLGKLTHRPGMRCGTGGGSVCQPVPGAAHTA